MRPIFERLLVISLGLPAWATAAPDPAPRAIGTVIDEYIHVGLASNLGLANQNLETQKSLAALDAARARYYPELGINARYTRADGGRQITIPVAQLLNPAYQTLNELLVASGGTPRFPMLGDESFPLQLAREQDTRITLRQPLYAPALPAGFYEPSLPLCGVVAPLFALAAFGAAWKIAEQRTKGDLL